MFIDFLLERFAENAEADAIVWRDQPFSYGWLSERIDHWRQEIDRWEIRSGAVVFLEADFSPNAVALFLALTELGAILVPFTTVEAANREKFMQIAEGEFSLTLDAQDQATMRRTDHTATHEIYEQLRSSGHPGLVLFSSGSTGESKAAVHDLMPLLEKFHVQRKSMRAISFLLYDHIGGINTMLYTLSNAGCLVTVRERSPDGVLGAVARHRVELLPTSPTFLHLILLSEAYRRHDLSTLKLLTYGTEPMPESTLRRFHDLFPEIRLLQTYGLSEVGILRSKSKTSDSLWIKVGGEGFETRVVDGVLHIKARSAMLGYLNAPSPFKPDGWMVTGDRVEVDGEYLRILGRQSEIINVGGEKVYPTEVENVILQLEQVDDVTVYGESNPITGNIVCARVVITSDEEPKVVARQVKAYCRERLQNYKVPVKVVVCDEMRHSTRFKKVRKCDG